ncbi:hypothetical protein DFH09DRAFT_279597 [Mycena vulgaris]|nr:hypothetical protein DFH09DRAFT_279597 [Mycena vulgaris]
MKTFLFAIISALLTVVQGSTLWSRLEESTTMDLRTEASETCGNMSNLVPLFQMYHTPKTVHFYTIEDSRVTAEVGGNDKYAFTGVAALIFPTAELSTVPFFCLINRVTTTFFYTASEAERDNARTSGGFSDYMTAGYIYPSQVCGSIPLYRLHYVAANADYMYTTSTAERDNAVDNMGFTYEGIAGYVFELASGINVA